MSLTNGAICAAVAAGEPVRPDASVEAAVTFAREADTGVGVGVGVGLGDGVGVGVAVGVAVGVGVGLGVGVAVVAALKYNPLTTALSPPVLVTLIFTCPLMSQTRYFPPLNEVTLRVSNNALLDASTTSIV
jgi:hypothetical protein